MKKLPWGIFAGICAMVVFFATIGIVAAFIVLNGVAGQTNTTASLFSEWYQTLLFVLDILFVIGLIGSLIMYVFREKNKKGEKIENENI